MAMANTKSVNATKNLCMQLNASELSAIIMKDSPNSNDRDAGFCSGSSEGGDDLSIDHSRLEPSSPTDASEDSVEVKVSPISLVRNKRKSSEPSKVVLERELAASTAPLKKRIRYTSSADSAVVLTPPAAPNSPMPAQSWDSSQVLPHELMPNPAHVFVRHPGVTTLHRAPTTNLEAQEEPLALVVKKSGTSMKEEFSSPVKPAGIAGIAGTLGTVGSSVKSPSTKKLQRFNKDKTNSADTKELLLPPPTLPLPRPRSLSTSSSVLTTTLNALNEDEHEASTSSSAMCSTAAGGGSRPQQRNYKNMTRERRIEANARERTRVHTISAAYETLRRSVPSYSNAQKLSKLSVLRVACSYILTLSRMAGEDYSADQSAPSVGECFEAVTATIQTEGKIRKKKDE